MVHDVLVVPISKVASESAFSTGGWVLDAFKSSLTPKIAQGLICSQDWFRLGTDWSIVTNLEENLESLDKLEKAIFEDMVTGILDYFFGQFCNFGYCTFVLCISGHNYFGL